MEITDIRTLLRRYSYLLLILLIPVFTISCTSKSTSDIDNTIIEINKSASDINDSIENIEYSQPISEEIVSEIVDRMKHPPVEHVRREPINYNVKYGLTKDKDNNITVGLYNTEKTEKGYQRYLTYNCNPTTKQLQLYDSNTYFVFGYSVESYGRIPVFGIEVNGIHYDTNRDDLNKEILTKIGNTDKFSFVVPNGNQYVMNIKERTKEPLPCSE